MGSRREWSTREVTVLRRYGTAGAAQIASLLDRTPAAVRAKARELRIDVTERAEALEVGADAEFILRLIARSTTASLCPRCSTRLACIKTTGLCRVCHLDAVIEHREVQLLELVRERRLATLRQQKARMRICERCTADFYPRRSSPAACCERCADSA